MRQRAIRMIRGCVTMDQLQAARRYAALADLSHDPVIKEWIAFKRLILKF